VTSVKKMKLNLFMGVLLGVIGCSIVTLISFLMEEEPNEEGRKPLPQMLILPPPEMEEDLDLHPPLDLNPSDHSNVA
jgi:hypothetical protein